MKMFVIQKEQLLRLSKYVGCYLVGLTLGAITGLLPFIALLAGLPIVLAERHMGRRASQAVALISIVATWFALDELSFVYVSLCLMIGYSLATIPEHVPLRLVLVQTSTVGFVWVLMENMIVKKLHNEGLLTLFCRQFQQALAFTVERMQPMALYTTEQIAQFQQYGQLMVETFQGQWAYLLFIYLLLSTLVTYALSRAFSPARQSTEDLLAQKAPLMLALAAVLLAGLHYLLPTAATGLVNNLWGIAALLMALSGFLLLFFYLRFLRVGLFWRILLGFYLMTSLIAWRVLFLVGLFDAVFDYRYYAKKRLQE